MGTDSQFLFQHKDIDRVEFRGFEDERREEFIQNLEAFYKEQDFRQAACHNASAGPVNPHNKIIFCARLTLIAVGKISNTVLAAFLVDCHAFLAVYDVAVGEVWSRESIAALRADIEAEGMRFEVVERFSHNFSSGTA